LDKFGIDINNTYYSEGYFNPFTSKIGFYYFSNLFIYADTDNEAFMAKLAKNTNSNTNKVAELIQKKDFETILCLIDKKYQVMLFEDIYDMIPKEKRYEIFKNIYVDNDYGLSEFNHEIVRNLLQCNKHRSNVDRLKFDEDGYIAIYRGSENLSSSLDKAYSWSKYKTVGGFFAKRFSTGTGILYKAKVKKNNIIDYMYYSKEKEILVLPEHVEDIKIIKKYTKTK
jgi:hypothetical protein